MVAQVSHLQAFKDEMEKEAPMCVAEGERLGLYDVIEAVGPVTLFGLAFQAMIPVSLAQRWLVAQTQAGYAVRDVVTGRYRTWCILADGPAEART